MLRRVNVISTVLFVIFIAFSSYIYANNTSTDEYIILNLHWSDGEITLNSLNKVTGLKKRTGRASSVQSFFYMLLTEDGEKIKSDYFRVPGELHYDYFDESTG